MYTEDRSQHIPTFNAIHLKSVGILHVEISETPYVKVMSTQDVCHNIKTEVRGEKLVISHRGILPVWMVGMPRIEVHVGAKDLQVLQVSGVGKIYAKNQLKVDRIIIENSGVGGIYLDVNAEEVHTSMSGVGEIDLKGFTKTHYVNSSGVGKLDAYFMEAEEVQVKAGGVGEVIVFATKKLQVQAGGIGDLKYRGDAEVVSSQSGIGSIKKIQ